MNIFTSYEKLIIKRFLFSKKTDGFISIFSWFSIVGIMIGVAVIIIVMAVMNGFREELTNRLLGINGHLNIYSKNNEIIKGNLNIFESLNLNLDFVPHSQTQALLITDNSSKAVILRGYDNKYLPKDHFLNNKINKGLIFSDNINDIVIGYALANQLGLDINDRIKIAIPKVDKTIFGNIPRFKTLIIKGIFDLGMYEYDQNMVFTHSTIANKLLLLNQGSFNQIEIFLENPFDIDIYQNKLEERISDLNLDLYITSWKDNNRELINALNVEKNVMFLILTLIIIVASMNIISGLIIFVKEKNKDIGILKTIGITNKSLLKIFFSIGLTIGLIGTFFGGVIGILFSFKIKSIQLFFEKIFQTNFFSKEIYYLSNLPAKIDGKEVAYVLLISIIICLVATTFPAYRSIKVDPIKSLKND
jgi:lipoprotein-releasing system permease protein